MGFSGFVRRRVGIRLGGIRGFGEKGGAGESKILKTQIPTKTRGVPADLYKPPSSRYAVTEARKPPPVRMRKDAL